MPQLQSNLLNLLKKKYKDVGVALEMLTATLNAFDDWVLIVDSEFRVLYINRAFAQIVGNCEGKVCYQLMGLGEMGKLCPNCQVQAAFKDGLTHTVNQNYTIDGKFYNFEMKSCPIKDQEGNVIAVAEVIKDLTQRNLVEEDLIQSKELLQRQLNFSNALNEMAENIISDEETSAILEKMVYIIGKTLGVDEAIMYQIDLAAETANKLCIWEKISISQVRDLASYKTIYLKHASEYLGRSKIWLESHVDAISPYIIKDNIHEFIHGVRGVKSFLWYPFAFHGDRYYLLSFNQMDYRRVWQADELDFIKGVAKQVKIAVQKLNFIHARQRAEKDLWEEKERALVTLQSIGDGVITTDAHGQVVFLNPVAEELTGWSNLEAKGLPLGSIFTVRINTHLHNLEEIPLDLDQETNSYIHNEELIHRGGKSFAIEHSTAPIRDREGNEIGAIVVFRDVSEKRALLNQMIYQAHNDPLTGIPNRVLFHKRLDGALLEAKAKNNKVAVMFFDLDRFKMINDTMGHYYGDLLIKTVAQRISACIKRKDTVARLGGDEFTLILTEINSKQDMEEVAQRVLQALQEPINLAGSEYYLTTSLGIAIYPDHGQDVDTLMKHADTAMYRAKEKGGNTFEFFHAEMNEIMQKKIIMENNIRIALIQEQFNVYYQPMIDVRTGQVMGAEALVHWQHPKEGLISPGDFIPLSEEIGLISALDELVIREVCKQAKQWHQQGLRNLPITVNLSANSFQKPGLLQSITKVLEETGVQAQWLELEITETAAMKNVDYTISVLKELREMGIGIAIDDFGTGYSSLSYLKKFPINKLKIDQSFVRDIPNDPDDVAIVTSIIGLAENLNLTVIAEGVETEEQLDFLKRNHCYLVQGFIFSRPIPAKQFANLIEIY